MAIHTIAKPKRPLQDPGPLSDNVLPHLPVAVIAARIAALRADDAQYLRTAKSFYDQADMLTFGSYRWSQLTAKAMGSCSEAERIEREIARLERHLAARKGAG